MAISTCIVSGTVNSLLGQGLNSVTVKASIVQPFFHTDGTQFLNYEVSTTTDTNGAWSLTLIQTATANAGAGIPLTVALEYPSGGAGDYLRREYTIIVPNQATANFSDLIAGQI